MHLLVGTVGHLPSDNCGACSFWYLGCKLLRVTVGHVTTSTVTVNHVPTDNCGACSYWLSSLFLVITVLHIPSRALSYLRLWSLFLPVTVEHVIRDICKACFYRGLWSIFLQITTGHVPAKEFLIVTVEHDPTAYRGACLYRGPESIEYLPTENYVPCSYQDCGARSCKESVVCSD
jgi:hypothetical protein